MAMHWAIATTSSPSRSIVSVDGTPGSWLRWGRPRQGRGPARSWDPEGMRQPSWRRWGVVALVLTGCAASGSQAGVTDAGSTDATGSGEASTDSGTIPEGGLIGDGGTGDGSSGFGCSA